MFGDFASSTGLASILHPQSKYKSDFRVRNLIRLAFIKSVEVCGFARMVSKPAHFRQCDKLAVIKVTSFCLDNYVRYLSC